MTDTPSGTDAATTEALTPRRSRASIAVDLAIGSGAECWHDPDGDPYIDAPGDDGVRRTMHVRPRACRTWLGGLVYGAQGTALGGQAAADAADVLAAMAIHAGLEREVHVRLAEHDGTIYLDIGDSTWRAVEITGDGWRIADSTDVPVRFRRPRGLRSLPVPTRDGGGWDALRALLGMSEGRDWILLVAWLVGTLHPSGPYPILALAGEAGAGKTTTGRALRSLIDPSDAPLRSPPREDRELVIAARNGHVLALDNLSYLPQWLSDGLCRIATGGGYSARQLYSDGDEVIYADRRPIILTSIEDVVVRGDLADRTVPVTLPRIPEHARRTETELVTELDKIRPLVLGDLLTAVATGLRRRDHVRLDRLPRMADYAHWVVSCEPALPWEQGAFLSEYGEARADAVQVATEADPVAVALLELLAGRDGWEGTAADLLAELEARRPHGTRPPRGWPDSGRVLSGRLTRVVPLLRAAGWDVLRVRTAGSGSRRVIRLSPVQEHSGESDRRDRRIPSHAYSGADSRGDGTCDVGDDTPPHRRTAGRTSSGDATMGDDGDDDPRPRAARVSLRGALLDLELGLGEPEGRGPEPEEVAL